MSPLQNQHRTSAAERNSDASRPLIIPVFLPHAGCPHHCAFCNQMIITGSDPLMPSTTEINQFIRQFLDHSRGNRPVVQLAFFGGNFLGLPKAQIVRLLEFAARSVATGAIDGIRFSTRPDTITDEQLTVIAGYPVQTVELGVQSMDDHVLSLSKRGHSAAHTISAVRFLKQRGYEIGMQMMVGLPGENEASCISSGERIADLAPDFVRIYPTLVLKGSLLEKWCREGIYKPLTLEEAVRRTARLYKIFEDKDIPVVRMGLQSTDGLEEKDAVLAGPYHPAFGDLVYAEVFYERASSLIQAFEHTPDAVCFKVHPRSISKLRGQKNNNINRLKHYHRIRSIRVVSDSSLSMNDIDISTI